MSNFTIKYVPQIDSRIIKYRLVRNPAYPGIETEVPGAVGVLIKRTRKPETREAIKDSVRREGFRNPILLYRTSKGTFLSFGGGRLQAAQELGVLVPAIVVDYTGDLDPLRDVTPDNWQEYFRDVPTLFTFTDIGVDTHYGLERNRNEWFDPAGVEWAKGSPEYMEAVLKESEWLDDGQEK